MRKSPINLRIIVNSIQKLKGILDMVRALEKENPYVNFKISIEVKET